MLTVCMHRELAHEGIKVLAVHPGRVKTQSAAPDADMEVSEASRALYQWILSHAKNAGCHLFDVVNDGIIDW